MEEILKISDNIFTMQDNIIVTINKFVPIIQTVINKYKKEDAMNLISYSIYTTSHKSPGIIKGLNEKELHIEACKVLNLGDNYVAPVENKEICDFIKDQFNYGIFGIIIELYKNLEISRRTINHLNKINSRLEIEIETKLNEDSTDEKVLASLSSASSTILTNLSKVRELISTVETDVQKLKALEELVRKEEFKSQRAFGNAKVPKSAAV